MIRLLWRRERDSNPCEIALKRFSRPPRYDRFDIPPYKRNYEIVLEKTLEEKTLLSANCACLPQIQGFFADCFRYGKEVSRPPRYDRFDTSPYRIFGFAGKGTASGRVPMPRLIPRALPHTRYFITSPCVCQAVFWHNCSCRASFFHKFRKLCICQ